MGEDMVATELVLPVNHQIRPVDLGAIAGCGHHQVSVRRKPKVIIIPTGNELVAATQMPSSGEIIEYNSLILRGQSVEYGGEASITDIIRDDADLLKQAIEDAKAQNPDLILMLSGSSAGSRDFTASVIREMGELLVHGVAARPGHPVIIGIIDAIPVIGVPGYPVSATLTGEIFIQPLIQKWLGIEIDPRPIVEAVMTRKLISPTGDDDFVRVTLARVGERLLATPLNSGAGVITSLVRADGLAQIPRFSEGVDMGGLVNVKLYRPMSVIENTIMAIGSHDPLLDLLGQFLATEYPDYRLASVNVGSLGGLIALKRKEAHLAGVHLLDAETGDYNVSYIKQYLPDEPVQLVTFAHREQGLIVAEGNPLNIQSLDDLSRIRYVNRQRGAGTRVLLDYELEKRGISSELISGYDHEEYTHLAVAAAIASGMADCGMGVRRAAVAMNLDFISVGWERYDLAIPNQYSNDESIYRLLEILRSENFKQELGAHPGYESSLTGTIHTFDQ
jgi:putative molybdopterin biosynthesis protein